MSLAEVHPVSVDQTAARRATSRRRGRLSWFPYLLLAPYVVLFLVFFLAPFLYALRSSFYVERIIGGTHFAGLSNYTQAFHDHSFTGGLLRMVLFGLLYCVLILIVGLGAALLLDSGTVRLPRTFRLGMFLPYAVPSAVAALMWGYLYSRDFGPLHNFSTATGVTVPDLLSRTWLLPSLVNIVTWEFLGYNMLIFYTALQGLPREQNEAAALDGAGRIALALRIKVPQLKPAIVLSTFFSIIGTLQLFTEPSIMHTIAPQVVGPDYSPNLYAYNLAFNNLQYNYSAAVSVLLGLIAFVGSNTLMFFARRSNR